MTDDATAPAEPPFDAVVAYVRAAAALLGLPLKGAQIGRVAAQLDRTRAMVQALQRLPFAPDDEPADLFVPAPFPDRDPA